MYKLREQRLKEFYTTGEVLSDVRNVTPQIETESPRFESSEIITKSSRYTTSSGETMTHADSIKDQDFMAMKSKEIRDSESPTRDFQTYQDTPQSYWKIQSSGGRFQAVGSGGQVEVSTQAHAERMSGQDDKVISASAVASSDKSIIDQSGQTKVISSQETSIGKTDATQSAVCDSSKESQVATVAKPEETQVVPVGGTYSKASHSTQKWKTVKTRTVIDESGARQTYTQSTGGQESAGSKESSVIDDTSKLKDVKVGTYVKEESGRYALRGKQEKTIDLSGKEIIQGSSSREETQKAIEQKAVSEATQVTQEATSQVEQRAVSEAIQVQQRAVAESAQIQQKAISETTQVQQRASQVVQEAVNVQKTVGAETVSRESEESVSRSAISKTCESVQQRSSQVVSQSTAVHIRSQSGVESVDVQKAVVHAEHVPAVEQITKVSETKSVESRVSGVTEQASTQKVTDSSVKSVTQISEYPPQRIQEDSSKARDVPGTYVKEESSRYALTAKQGKVIHLEPRPADIESVSSRGEPTTYETPQRATPIHHPQELQIEKGDVDYTTTYQSHFTPKRISVEVSPSHAQFASSLRAPSLSPVRSVSPAKSVVDRLYGSRSPTKSVSRGSIDRDRGSPSKKFSSPEPRRQSPTKDVGRRSSTKSTNGGYQRPISPKKHTTSPSEKVDETYKTRTAKEKRKFSSHSSRAATKKRSGTPGVSPSSSPIPKNERGRTTSSCSSSSYVTENETHQVQQNVTDFIVAERSDSAQIRDQIIESTLTVQTNEESTVHTTKVREKSPEYSSDGSLMQELYLKSKLDQPVNGFTPIKASPDNSFASPDDRNVKAPAPSPAAPKKKKKSVISDSDDTDDVSKRNKKSKSPTPVSKKSYSSRSSSVSPYSSPERKFPSIGASPDRERFPSSSPASSPERKSSPVRKTVKETRPKKELTEYPSQRRFQEKEKKKPTPIPSRPTTRTKSPVTKKPSATPKSPIKKSPPSVERKPSDKKITSVSPVKKSPVAPKTMRPVAPVQKKPETKKPTSSKKELTEYPSQRRFPEKEKKRTPSPPAKKSRSPVRSAFVRTDSGKKHQPITLRNSDTKITTRKSSKDKIEVKDSTRTNRTSTLLKDFNRDTKSKTSNFIRTEVKVETRQKTARKNVVNYNWENEKPPAEFSVDDSSSSRENLRSGQKKKPTQSRTSSGPIVKPKKELPQQRSEPRLNITHTIASKIRAESRKPPQKTDSKTGVMRRDSTAKVSEKKTLSDSVTKETRRTSKEFLVNEQAKVTVAKKQTVQAGTVQKKTESSSSESEDEKETCVTRGEGQGYAHLEQRRIEETTKITTTTVQDTNLLQQPVDEIPRSSRESSMSPDARPVKFIPVSDTEVEELRPRYADRVSEPDDDSDLEYRRRTPQKVIPEPVIEEEEPKEPEVSVKTITQKFVTEQVTDLEEKEIDKEELKIDVSVAERVNQFIETARASASSPQPSRPEDITLKGLDDTINAYMETTEEFNETNENNAVLKAKSMFETIANNQTVSKAARRELQRQDDIINRPSVFDTRKTETHESQEQEIDVQVKEEIKKPIGKLKIDELAPKPIEHQKPEVRKQIGKVNVSRFETETKESGRDTFPRRKAPSPDRQVGKFDTFPSRKCSRKHSTDSEKSPTRESSPREVSPKRKSPTKEITEPVRKPSIPKTESKTVADRYPFAKQDSQKPPKPSKSPSPTRKDTPIANHISPDKITPGTKSFKSVQEEHPKVNGFLPTDEVVLPNVGKPTKIPEDSALKAPALLKKQVFDGKEEDVGRRSPDKLITRKDSLADEQKTEQVKISKFGVSLRKTNSGGSLGRRASGDIAKKESEIEKIFDLDLLEEMLEKARGYEERRLIRQQIRIVKKMIENGEITYTSRRSSEVTTEKQTVVRSHSKSPQKYAPKEETTKTTVTVNIVSNVKRPKSPEKKSTSPDRKSPDKLSNRIESQEKIYNRQTIESENKKRTSQEQIKTDVPLNNVKKPAQKQTSKTEIYITPTSATTKSSYSVNKTIKKSHIENETKETNLTDSITSSYGVGPTDEKGRPLFGLKALRRQNTGNNQETETVFISTTEETDSRDIKDSSGRSLFGLKALKISSSKQSENNSETMPSLEQPESPQLKDIVARHEKHARGNTVSQTQQHRPPARLRDNFVQSQSERHEEFMRKETEAEEASRLMKDRGQSLRAMIQRHESLTESDKKKSENFSTSSSYATSTVVRSSAVRKADGTVSVKKEVIEGESVSKNGEEPVTKITKTEYSYQTPEQDKQPISITEIVSDEEKTGKSVRRSSNTVSSRSNTSDSIHSRTSSISSSSKSRKSPSPERKSQTYVSSTTVRSSSKTIITSDNTTKSKDETDTKSSRKQMSDRLSQLSKKFSNDSIDSRKSSVSEQRRESSSCTAHYATETQSSINRSSFSKSESQSEILTGQRKSSTTEITDAERRRQSSSPIEEAKESLLRKGQSTTEETEHITSHTFSKVGRGGAVKALSQKFQQAADSPGLKHSASMEVRIGSTRASSTTSEQLLNEREIESKNRNETNQGFTDEYTEVSESRSQTESKSFIGNSAKVTGVQDLISRMRAADSDNVPGEAVEDSEARSLLNKFLGASVMMSGMEPLVKASGASSATLVSQVERQRILHSTPSKSSLKDSAASKVKESRKEEEEDIDLIWDERKLRQLLDACTDYEGRRKLRARLRVVMAERSACEDIVAAAREEEESNKAEEGAKSVQQQQAESETTVTSKSSDGGVTKTEVSSKSYSYSVSSSSSSSKVSQAGSTNKPVSPFAKFQQLERQNSGSSSPSSPRSGNAPLFTFTDPKLSRSASTVKDRLLYWCQMKTKNYKNIQIENFSTSWSNGLAFCALIHHFLPESFDYDSLSPKDRRKNFELAFRVAEKEAGICPLLDVDDMVMMKKPDWKCVFTYVQAIYLRFKDED